MNKQTTILFVIIVGLLTFGLGWFLHDMKYLAEGVKADGKRLESLQTLKTNNKAGNITGKFIIKDANCAGLNFINDTLVSWTNESDCKHPDTLKLCWIDSSTFFAKDIKPVTENCPPRVSIYQVVTFDQQHLILKEIWTGWNSFKDDKIEFLRK
jgi:hypothetical protein